MKLSFFIYLSSFLNTFFVSSMYSVTNDDDNQAIISTKIFVICRELVFYHWFVIEESLELTVSSSAADSQSKYNIFV